MTSGPIARELRALLIIEGFRATSVYPVPLDAIHVVGYFSDALASVWNTQTLTETVLKTHAVPRDRKLQAGIDRLVGRGVLLPTSVSYEKREGGARLFAEYSANDDFALPIVLAAKADRQWGLELELAREIAIAVASLGKDRIARTVMADASYSDPLLDFETVVDLEPDQGSTSRTADVSDKLAEVALSVFGQSLGPTELTSLYLRHLYPYTEASA